MSDETSETSEKPLERWEEGIGPAWVVAAHNDMVAEANRRIDAARAEVAELRERIESGTITVGPRNGMPGEWKAHECELAFGDGTTVVDGDDSYIGFVCETESDAEVAAAAHNNVRARLLTEIDRVNQENAELKAKVARLKADRDEAYAQGWADVASGRGIVELVARAYGAGVARGHESTVEGCYRDVHPRDYREEFSDIARELISEVSPDAAQAESDQSDALAAAYSQGRADERAACADLAEVMSHRYHRFARRRTYLCVDTVKSDVCKDVAAAIRAQPPAAAPVVERDAMEGGGK